MILLFAMDTATSPSVAIGENSATHGHVLPYKTFCTLDFVAIQMHHPGLVVFIIHLIKESANGRSRA